MFQQLHASEEEERASKKRLRYFVESPTSSMSGTRSRGCKLSLSLGVFGAISKCILVAIVATMKARGSGRESVDKQPVEERRKRRTHVVCGKKMYAKKKSVGYLSYNNADFLRWSFSGRFTINI